MHLLHLFFAAFTPVVLGELDLVCDDGVDKRHEAIALLLFSTHCQQLYYYKLINMWRSLLK